MSRIAYAVCGLSQKFLALRPCLLEKLGTLPIDFFRSHSANGPRMLGNVGEMPHHAGIEKLPQRIVHGPKLQIDELIVKVGNAAAVEPVESRSQGCSAVGCSSRQSRKTWHW